ncbi:DoxX-like family protein [Mesorhizobium tamadayense]|uniref:DoxX-like family protein n=1 Tax=Mesorhizobium tamadayense TaxID=425306 RepID=UPI001FE04D0C|nr:DoxX-like family protein [Mesorhizobium tamadayense]
MFAVLSAFWLVSGIVGLVRQDAAADILISRGLPGALASGMVLAGSVADIVVGAAVVVRPFARLALIAMVAVTLLYLAAATGLAPDLWLDPLGPS